MSKIYEALENAEKERVAGLNKKTPILWGRKEEKKTSSALEPEEEKKTPPVQGPASTPALAPHEVKKAVPVGGPGSTPAAAPKEEKKAAPVLEPKEAWTERTVSPPTLKPKEEKKAAPVLKPKQERMERPDPPPTPELSPVGTLWKWFRTKRPAPARTPEPKVERKTAPVMGPSSTPPPVLKEEKKAAPVLEPKQERMERPAPSSTPEPNEVKKTPAVLGPSFSPPSVSEEEKKTPPVVGPSSTPPSVAKEEKKPVPVLEPKKEKAERYEENAEREWMVELKKAPPLALDLIEEERPAPVLEFKKERLERLEENEKQRAMELNKSPTTPAPAAREEKKPAPVLEQKGERVERPQIVPPAKIVSKPVHPDKPKSDLPLVSQSQPGSLGAEQFRKLRTHVLKLNMSDPPKTIMVTSATEGEGKTFVSANLAAGIAHDLHFHALLVDCDLRKPSLSHWFGVQNGRGLSDYLVGKKQLSELLMKTEMEKLSILTGGSAQEKPAELIGSRKMEALIHELKSRYNDRYIILDATPLLVTSEPEVLSRLVDGILIVVRAGVTPRETVKQAIASLDPKKILGFVLNDVEFKSSGLAQRYFGSGRYYNRYGYGMKEAELRSGSKGKSPFRKRSA